MRIAPMRIARALSLLVLFAAGPVCAAPVFFTDGAAHFLPGDPAFMDDDWIILNGASILEISGETRVTGEPSTAIDVAFGGDAITSAAGTALRIQGGGIAGGAATGVFDVASPVAGIVAFGGFAIDAAGELFMDAGFVAGGAATVVAIDATSDRATAISGVGLQLGAATAAIHDGGIESGPALAGGGSFESEAVSGEALIVGSATTLLVHYSAIRAGEARADNGAWVGGDALATGGTGLRTSEGSTTVIESCVLKGGDAFAVAGSVSGSARAIPGSALRIEDGSRVVLRGGSYSIGIGLTAAAIGSPTEIALVPALEVDISGAAQPARLAIFGGTYRGASSLRVAQTDAVPADARIDILGGDLDSAGSVDLDLAHPFVTTSIHGTDIALDGIPIATGPVTATTGTLSGTLQLGSPFSWTFERRNGAPLQVWVPEPRAGLAPTLIGLTLLASRRSRSVRLREARRATADTARHAARL